MNSRYIKAFFALSLVLTVIFLIQKRSQSRNENQTETSSASNSSNGTAAPSANQRSAASSLAKNAVSAEDYINSKSRKRWSTNKNEKGEIVSFTNGELVQKVESPSQALAVAEDVAESLGVSPKQIGEMLPSPEPTLTKTFTFKQVVGGYDVYQSSIQVVTRTEDDAVIMINNSLKEIAQAPINPGFTEAEAFKKVRERFYKRNPIQKGQAQLVIFENQLAWVFLSNFQNPNDLQEIVVGTQNQDVISAFSVRRN